MAAMPLDAGDQPGKVSKIEELTAGLHRDES
jgi:hypothetical protein